MTGETIAADRAIVVDQYFPHAPDKVWKTITDPNLIGRWLRMTPHGFEASAGSRFTMQTTPAGEWDGTIHCQVIEADAPQRLVFRWQGGHPANQGYGAPLDTQVAFTLTPEGEGTRLRLVHSGFKPANETAYRGMSEGWPGVIDRIGALTGEGSTAH